MIREDWVEFVIDEVISKEGIFNDGDWVESKDQDPSGDVRLIQLADIGDGKFENKSNRFLTSKKAEELNCTFLEEGDILVARMPYPLGRSILFPLKGKHKYVTVVDVAIIRHEKKYIDTKFLLHNINSPISRRKIEELQSGTTRKRISRKNLSKIKFPLAPLPEQRAIVAKIEELFSELDNGIYSLKKAKDQLGVYRQAVLKAAFEGELTKKWREENKNLITADDLIKEIEEERIDYHESFIKKWKDDVKEWEKGDKKEKKPSKPRKIKKLSSFSNEELNNFGSLPIEWRWTKIDKLQGHESNSLKAGPFGSSLKKSFYVEEGYKIYGQEQVIAGDWTIGDYYVDEEKYIELENCAIKPRDVLISLVGTAGKVLILPGDIEKGLINPRLVKVSLLENYYLPEFFKYYFESAYLKNIYGLKSHGATMEILNLSIIRELPFPLLTIKEQEEIIKEIESRLSVCENIEANIKEALEEAEALRQSILKKAFKGKLLSSEELAACKKENDWESAAELLKRIKEDKKGARI